jgi:type IV pilus assembly protein PilV
MKRRSTSAVAPAQRGPRAQRGAFLLEALVGILIFTLGVLGLVALQARAIGYTSDATYRGEAAYLAGAYVSKMWADSRGNIPLRYVAAGQPEFDAFALAVQTALPGAAAIAGNPSVAIVQPGAGGTTDARADGSGITLTATGTLVTVIVQWQPPRQEGSAVDVIHNYTMTSIIAHN